MDSVQNWSMVEFDDNYAAQCSEVFGRKCMEQLLMVSMQSCLWKQWAQSSADCWSLFQGRKKT